MRIQTLDFHEVKGPGAGDHATNKFMKVLRECANNIFAHDYSEAKICGACGFAVDFYFPEEQTVVEFAFGLDKPMSEFERDIFKCLLAQNRGHKVRKLNFVTKPGGESRVGCPGPRAIGAWVREKYGLEIDGYELQRSA